MLPSLALPSPPQLANPSNADAGGTIVHTNFVTFNNIPEGSYGCQLEMNFPAGRPIPNEGTGAINVYTVGPDGQDTGLFGTVICASSPVAPTKFVINSATCSALR
ncbi:hypothetical protein CC78DRAFT_622578 [Lojkania enalia]|uniref:Ubiquitin 3 binding protein But2 C-terminal domain-containing protein n=1 Tax=Lojkania enalia TaxID=147567 RepID=A0A9P4MXH8_9PLEO|nr:hypothetical protein CC78DRAFT_622578 [Didymosphaeria enalia]